MNYYGRISARTIACFMLTGIASPLLAGDLKGKVVGQGLRSPENIVVYADAIPGQAPPHPTQHAVMDQVHLAFVPHVLAVMQGTTVDFKNDDAVGHNVFWPSINHNKKLAGNLGTWPQGGVKTFTFKDVGDVPLLCNVHPEMSGYVFVTPSPYFAVTEKDGSFNIRDMPAGQYTIRTWSEEAKPTMQQVTVGSGAETISITVKK